jgi:phosphoribosylanthranilate isomerase
MPSFKVKICGISRTEDALRAVELGASLIGLIFYGPSPRYVSPEQAQRIRKALSPQIEGVGVFVNEKPDYMIEIALRVGLHVLQVHGELAEEDITTIHRAGLRVIQPFHVKDTADYKRVLDSRADYVMLDNATRELPGGTGTSFDWSLKPPRLIPNLVLAGGIHESNIEEGVRVFQPSIVDVNSGVEASPGVKSEQKMERLFEVCRRIWCETKSQ